MPFSRTPLKYRHVYGQTVHREQWYEGVPISRNAHDGHFVACNPSFLAVAAECSGGGSFVVVPTTKTGRVSGINQPRICGHSGSVLDLAWNPFDDHIVASASNDATVKLWRIPECGLTESLTDPLLGLGEYGQGHTRGVLYLQWHPSAAYIMATAGYDHQLLVWNAETGSVQTQISCHADTIMSVEWNPDGRLLATTSKDKFLRVIDPRSGAVVAHSQAHAGPKAAKVVFVDEHRLASVGFGAHGERECAVWDMNNFSEAVQRCDIDQSSGMIFPFYDPDCCMLYLAGKGDGNIRYYELAGGSLHYLSQFNSGTPQRGLGVMPKRGLDQSRCEVMRFYKLHVTANIVEPLSMIAPRRGAYRLDIYPPTRAPLPALSAADWCAGQNRGPLLVDLNSGRVVNPPASYPSELITPIKSKSNPESPASLKNISLLTSSESIDPPESRVGRLPPNTPFYTPMPNRNGYYTAQHRVDPSESVVGGQVRIRSKERLCDAVRQNHRLSSPVPLLGRSLEDEEDSWATPPESRASTGTNGDTASKQNTPLFDKNRFKHLLASFESSARIGVGRPISSAVRRSNSLAEASNAVLRSRSAAVLPTSTREPDDSVNGNAVRNHAHKTRRTERPRSFQSPMYYDPDVSVSAMAPSPNFPRRNGPEQRLREDLSQSDDELSNAVSGHGRHCSVRDLIRQAEHKALGESEETAEAPVRCLHSPPVKLRNARRHPRLSHHSSSTPDRLHKIASYSPKAQRSATRLLSSPQQMTHSASLSLLTNCDSTLPATNQMSARSRLHVIDQAMDRWKRSIGCWSMMQSSESTDSGNRLNVPNDTEELRRGYITLAEEVARLKKNLALRDERIKFLEAQLNCSRPTVKEESEC